MQYTLENLVRLARRDGNTIRPYLYVNPLQAKHIPTDPEDMLEMCRALSKRISEKYSKDSLYVIGLAETATAVAAATASFLKNTVYFQATTREPDAQEPHLDFTESHSHATEQMLRTAGIAERIRDVDRVLIIDDEVTTGNTILKLIASIRANFDAAHLRFSIVCLLNSMTGQRRSELEQAGVDCICLADLPHEYRKESILDIPAEPDRIRDVIGSGVPEIEELLFPCGADQRVITPFSAWTEASAAFASAIRRALAKSGNDREAASGAGSRVLVLGTEEFMYPAIIAGDMLRREKIAREVRVHATTRSPILPSGREGYPLFVRYSVRSMYDDRRRTFVYNLSAYDRVIIVTDAAGGDKGLSDLILALRHAGNERLLLARWKGKDAGSP